MKGQISSPENPLGNAKMQWIADRVSYRGDDCLIWPFGRSRGGYGTYTRQGKAIYVHRYMCEAVNGTPPTSKHHAAHSCGNGTAGCVNPSHLSWKTNRENQLDAVQHGTHKRFKLTAAIVAEIRASKGTASVRVVAQRYRVSETNIRHIYQGKIWRCAAL